MSVSGKKSRFFRQVYLKLVYDFAPSKSTSDWFERVLCFQIFSFQTLFLAHSTPIMQIQTCLHSGHFIPCTKSFHIFLFKTNTMLVKFLYCLDPFVTISIFLFQSNHPNSVSVHAYRNYVGRPKAPDLMRARRVLSVRRPEAPQLPIYH